MRNIIVIFSIITIAFLHTSCDDFFGNKTDVSFIDIPDFQTKPIAYVPIQPVLDQFVRPTDVLAGFDDLVYVADNGREEIIGLDQSGRELYSFPVPGVVSVVQDRRLNLLAIGTKDTVINGGNYTFSCIYRLNLQGLLGYGLNHAKIVNQIVHPFYFKNTFSSSDLDVKFQDMAIVGESDYYVSRTGFSNNANQFGGPDNAVLLFDEVDNYITPISVTTRGGVFKDFFKSPFGMTSAAQPPQISAGMARDFIFTSMDQSADNLYRVRGINYNETDFGVEYNPNDIIPFDTLLADGSIFEAGKFSEPVDVTLSGDGSGNIFVIDRAKDSLYQFTLNGLEGIKPPPGSGLVKYVKVSFGGTGIELTQFKNPRAVAYLNEIVYVADEGNGRVLRFKLTSDFD
ncbi:MAG: hypothetical protein ACPGVC_02845 [Salibacteraceae bacterium]